MQAGSSGSSGSFGSSAPSVVAPWGDRYPELDRLVCLLRKDGKKSAAVKLVVGAAGRRRDSGVSDPYQARSKAIHRLHPVVEVRSVSKSGQKVQRPLARSRSRQLGASLRLLRRVVGGGRVPRDRAGGRSAVDRLALARLDTLKRRGSAWDKRLVQHRSAVAAIGSLRVQR